MGAQKLELLKTAMAEELDIPPSIYENLFHWILFSAHALVTAQMYSNNLSVISFLNQGQHINLFQLLDFTFIQ